MPELGESVTEGTITAWLKKVGDSVDVDEPLLEVSTDKVDTEIPSPVAGTLLEILYEEDDTVDVGEVIARVGSGSPKKAEPKQDDAEGRAEERGSWRRATKRLSRSRRTPKAEPKQEAPKASPRRLSRSGGS